MTTNMMNMMPTREERAALERAQAKRADRLRDLGRALADGQEVDEGALASEELRQVHDEARRLRRLRAALLARRSVADLMAAEERERAKADARRAELIEVIRAAQEELSMIGAPVAAAARKAHEAQREAAEALMVLTPEERARVTELERVRETSRAQANALRKRAADAPGFLARAQARLADAARGLAGFRRGYDPSSWEAGLVRAHEQATADVKAAELVSPRELERQAAELERQAEQAERDLAATWAKIEAAAGLPPVEAPAAPERPKGRRSR